MLGLGQHVSQTHQHGELKSAIVRSAEGAMMEVAMAISTMMEYMSCESTPSCRPMVAMMISMAPRAFRPAP